MDGWKRAQYLVLILAVFATALAADWRIGGGIGPAMAWADDDDDGNDDDDDDGPVLRRQPRIQTPRPQVRRETPAPPPAQRAENEVLARGLDDGAIAGLTDAGFTILQETALSGGDRLHRLGKPAALDMNAARAAVEAAGASADFNHFYRSEQAVSDAAPPCPGADCPARQMIGWPARDSCAAAGRAGPVIGMVDTGLNAAHAALSGADLRLHRLEGGAPPSGAVHGTAVAALLIGDPASRAPGLVPHLPLIAV
ncbi:MAG: protease, partial [Paracoccus sp. (in: a-proteobacteria)]|nr:protease [Paracoccus sp. (in: a-proteobacteria)]